MAQIPGVPAQRDDAHLLNVIHEIHANDATLGYRFITDELDTDHGILGENRVHRDHRPDITRSALSPAQPDRFHNDYLLAVVDAHGVVRHAFVADDPNNAWLWDISEHPTREAKLYICAIKGRAVEQDRRLLHRHQDEVDACAGRDAQRDRDALTGWHDLPLRQGRSGLRVLDSACPRTQVMPPSCSPRSRPPASSRTRTGWSIKKFVRTARRYRPVQIRVGNHLVTAEDPLPDDLRDALAQIT